MEKKKQEETQISPKIIQKRERIVLSWTKPKRKRETKQKKKKIRKPKLTTTKKNLNQKKKKNKEIPEASPEIEIQIKICWKTPRNKNGSLRESVEELKERGD